jgi:hypothetical protein
MVRGGSSVFVINQVASDYLFNKIYSRTWHLIMKFRLPFFTFLCLDVYLNVLKQNRKKCKHGQRTSISPLYHITYSDDLVHAQQKVYMTYRSI